MRSLILALTLAVALIAVAGCARPAQEDTYRRAALKAASWLQANAIERPEGTVWAADPQDSTTVTTNLYSGSSGVVLFFLEAYRIAGQPAYLDEARTGADYLLATLPDSLEEGQSGLYTGVAGLGFAGPTLLTGTLTSFGFGGAGSVLEWEFTATGGDALGLSCHETL